MEDSLSLFITRLIRNPDGSFSYVPDQIETGASVNGENYLNSFALNFKSLLQKISFTYENDLGFLNSSNAHDYIYLGIICLCLVIILLLLNILISARKIDKEVIFPDTKENSLLTKEISLTISEDGIQAAKVNKVKKPSHKREIRPFFNALIKEFNETFVNTDLVIIHFILSIQLLLEGFYIVTKSLRAEMSNGNQSVKKELRLNGLYNHKNGSSKNIYSKIDLQLVNGEKYLSKNGIGTDMSINNKRDDLMKLTNDELRNHLKGMRKISRLKKSELVDLIINRFEVNNYR